MNSKCVPPGIRPSASQTPSPIRFRCFHTNGARCERNAIAPYKYCELHMNESKCTYCTNNRCGRHCIYSKNPADSTAPKCGTLVPDNATHRVCHVHRKLWCAACNNTRIHCEHKHCAYSNCYNLAARKIGAHTVCILHEHTVCTSCGNIKNPVTDSESNCIYCDQYICRRCNLESMHKNRLCCTCVSDICIQDQNKFKIFKNGATSFPLNKYIDIYVEYADLLMEIIPSLHEYSCRTIMSYSMPSLSIEILCAAQLRIKDSILIMEEEMKNLRHRISTYYNTLEKISMFDVGELAANVAGGVRASARPP